MNDPYYSWRGMMARCYQKTNHKYPRYGGRGISVCDRWHVFDNFLNDMGMRPDGTTLDRVDNDGHYEPNNCEWATHKQQNRNRSDNRMITFMGDTLPLPEWADRIGISRTTLKRRFERGWTAEMALSTGLLRQGNKALPPSAPQQENES